MPSSSAVYEAALEGLVRVDEEILRRSELPSIYEGGVRYRREPTEHWRTVADVIRDGWGDCEDLAAARAAELRRAGRRARVRVRRSGPRTYHAVVEHAYGKIEDPSRRLGMLACDDRWDDADVEIGAQPAPMISISWTVDRTPTGWRGTITVPLVTGRALLVRGPTRSSKDAARDSALDLATSVLDSPVARAMLPAPAAAALDVARSPVAREAAKKVWNAAKSLKFW